MVPGVANWAGPILSNIGHSSSKTQFGLDVLRLAHDVEAQLELDSSHSLALGFWIQPKYQNLHYMYIIYL